MSESFSPLFPNVPEIPQRPGTSVRARLVSSSPAVRLQPSAPPKIESKPVTFVAADAAAISAAAGAPVPIQPATPRPPQFPTPTPANPTVTLRREGEHITGIRIVCPCGQVIDLECGY